MLIGCSVVGCAVYLGCVLLGNGEEMRSARENQAVTRLQAGDFTDLALLKQSFGAPVPYWEQVHMAGETRNLEQYGETVRRMEMRFENGCLVRAVTPRTAAALVWEKQADIPFEQGALDVLGAPVLKVSREDGHAFGFSLDDTYYAVFVPETEEKQAADMLSQMIWLY